MEKRCSGCISGKTSMKEINRLFQIEKTNPKSFSLIIQAIKCLEKGYISRGKFKEIVQLKDRCDIDNFINNIHFLIASEKSLMFYWNTHIEDEAWRDL
jgi:hypothetical protein